MSSPARVAGRSAGPRVAITTDWLTSFGGAERVLEQLRTIYPAAPIFTSVYDPEGLPLEYRGWDVRPTMLQALPGVRRYSRALLPFMPMAFGRLKLADYDVVIAMSSAFSKSVELTGGTRSLCYCLTPPRYLWDLTDSYLTSSLARVAAAPAIQWLRTVDRRSADRMDEIVAISQTVARRVERAYGREVSVLYPPVDTDRIRPTAVRPEDFYLVVSRLVGYKRVDLAVQACSRLGRNLVVVGDGPERQRLERMAGPSVRFTGILPDREVASLYARSRGFIFPGLEDFGIAPVEAQAAGRPVIAFGEGGAAETVRHGITGVHFAEQSVEALADAILELERSDIDPGACRLNAERFGSARFRDGIESAVLSLTT